MAVWQCSFWALPQMKVVEVYGCVPESIEEEDFNAINWFENYDGQNIKSEITFLSPSTHWSDSADFWGAYESDSVTLWHELDVLSEVSFRVDLRGNYKIIASKMVGALDACRLILVGEDLVVHPLATDFIDYLEFVARVRNIKRQHCLPCDGSHMFFEG